MAKETKKSVEQAAEALSSVDSEPKARSRRAVATNGKNLVVVESPAKAKTINRYLGDDYIVKASMGHVRDLPTKQIGVDLEHNFTPTYEPLAGRRAVLADLKKSAKTAPTVFLATDLDREGEAIAWHLAESLGVPPERIRRVIFNEITKSAIVEAFAHPRDIDMDMVNAQQARRIMDRIVGYQVSPLLWRKITTGLSAGRVQSVAVRLIVDREREIEAFNPEEYWKIAGVFTPAVADAPRFAKEWTAFMAKRDEKDNPPNRDAQQQFLSEHNSFWAELASWNGQRFSADNEAAALEAAVGLGLAVKDLLRREDPAGKGPSKNRVTVVGAVGETMPAYTVRGVHQRDSRSNPLGPFTTANLQQAASVQLRYSASRTMRIAQQLYEGIEVRGEGSIGLITYMRTDSAHLSAEAVAQVRSMITEQFGPRYVPDRPNTYASGERAQEAHEAIRPTDVRRNPQSVIGALTEEQYKLYELIWKRFVACQMTPAVWKVTEADIVCQAAVNGQPIEAVLKALGRRMDFDGFMRVAGLPRTGDQLLPELSADQKVAPVSLDPTQHFTQAPPRFTEAALVKAMEADGIGRPSTYASTIQTIQDREYVLLVDRAFHPTPLGTLVTDKLVKHFPRIFDVHFTAHMENELDKVEDATAQWQAVLAEFYSPFAEDLAKATVEMVHAKAETQPSEYVCETCGKPMVYRFSKNGRYLACTGYPECKTTSPVDAEGKKVQRVEVNVPCPNCGKNMMLRRSRFGPFLGCGDYPTCKGILPCDKDGNPLKVVKEEDIKEVCSLCGAPMAVRRKGRSPFLGCTKYPDCQNTAKLPEGIRLASAPKVPAKEAGVNCPKCGKPMVIRTGKRGEFIACSGFPKCRNAVNMDKLEELKTQAANAPKPEKKAKKK